MKQIDAMGLACPIPVIEAKKALAAPDTDAISILVDNKIAVENLQKMAVGFSHEFSYEEAEDGAFAVSIRRVVRKNP